MQAFSNKSSILCFCMKTMCAKTVKVRPPMPYSVQCDQHGIAKHLHKVLFQCDVFIAADHHSFITYITLREALEYDWFQIIAGVPGEKP